MILSDQDIQKNIEEGRVKITPYPDFDAQLGPCSLDLHLGSTIKAFRPSSYTYIDFLKGVLRRTKKHIILIQDGARYHTSKNVEAFLTGMSSA